MPPYWQANLTTEEAQRQLVICNACRYCEGYCAVFPALERRSGLNAADIAHLANLCHDCQACLSACMYAAPHEFAINLPELFTRARRDSYALYIGRARHRPVRRLRQLSAFGATALLIAGIIVVVSVSTLGVGALVRSHKSGASPYDVLPYEAMLALGLIPALWAVGAIFRAARRYWGDIHGEARPYPSLAVIWRALSYAASLRYMRGAGAGCHFGSDVPSPARRRLHFLASYGLLGCLLSTITAAVLQDFLGRAPPYALISFPVVLGSLGGLGLITGCTGMLVLRYRTVPRWADADGPIGSYGFLVALDAIAVTGMVVLITRSTEAFGPVMVVHLAAVVTCIAIAPYTKFVHFVYRFLSLVEDELETAAVAAK
jgi:citrate/tricarballylate utilization protein